MRAITIFRAMAWLGVAVVFWSLNMRWGTDPNLPNGPPGQWERPIVGAGLLAMISALAISLSGRKHTPPSWLARGIAVAGGVLTIAIALYLHSDALATGFGDAILGGGWLWLLAGGGLVLGAAAGTLKLPPGKPVTKPRKRK